MIDQWWFLLLLGLGVGTIGTLIGAGGGFLLVPIMLLLMPGTDPQKITALSLGVVFCNATSGTIAYLRMGRVDLKSAAWFALATFPGALLGAYATKFVPRGQFNIVFAMLMIVVSAILIFKPEPIRNEGEPVPGHTIREITDVEGNEHRYSFPMGLGMVLSVFVGFVSSLFGIGGGIIHVPILNRTLNFPVHIATATSQAILGFMALTGTAVHFAEGNLDGQMPSLGLLGLGAVIGAQLGARLSNKVKGVWIIRSLAIALALVGIRILLMGAK